MKKKKRNTTDWWTKREHAKEVLKNHKRKIKEHDAMNGTQGTEVSQLMNT